MRDVNQLIDRINAGDSSAARELYPLVYEELRKLAKSRVRSEGPIALSRPTSIVHEAYFRLCGSDKKWDGKGHLFAAAAEAMRCILVDRARRRWAKKRGGEFTQVDLNESVLSVREPTPDVIAVSEALEGLEEEYPEHAKLVKLRYFVGLTAAEAAEAMGISKATADRKWRFASAWLIREIRGPEN